MTRWDKSKLPSRHTTVGPKSAPHRAFYYAMGMSDEEWDAVIDVHLNGAFNVSRAACEQFRKQSSGSILHMTSTAGLIGNLGQANYSAAKMGIIGLSRSISIDMARSNVRSNCLAPFAFSRMTNTIPTKGGAGCGLGHPTLGSEPQKMRPQVTKKK